MARYDTSALKKIGTQCKNRLPPASAVQAMFLYEMQREAEAQALFQGQMFELARVEDNTKAQDTRISSLEEQIKEVHKKATTTDIDQRLATSKVRTDALAARLNEHFVRLGEYGRRLTDVETAHTTTQEAKEQENVKLDTFAEDIKNIKSDVKTAHTAIKEQTKKENTKLDSFAKHLTAIKEQADNETTKRDSFAEDLKTIKKQIETEKAKSESFATDIKAIKSTLESADKEIGLLFEERDGLYDHIKVAEEGIAELKKSNERIDKLEDLVRVLTIQKSSPPSSADGSRSPSVHFCPITTKGGENIDLVIPKGKGFVSLGKEDIKAFVPGKAWGA